MLMTTRGDLYKIITVQSTYRVDGVGENTPTTISVQGKVSRVVKPRGKQGDFKLVWIPYPIAFALPSYSKKQHDIISINILRLRSECRQNPRVCVRPTQLQLCVAQFTVSGLIYLKNYISRLKVLVSLFNVNLKIEALNIAIVNFKCVHMSQR